MIQNGNAKKQLVGSRISNSNIFCSSDRELCFLWSVMRAKVAKMGFSCFQGAQRTNMGVLLKKVAGTNKTSWSVTSRGWELEQKANQPRMIAGWGKVWMKIWCPFWRRNTTGVLSKFWIKSWRSWRRKGGLTSSLCYLRRMPDICFCDAAVFFLLW